MRSLTRRDFVRRGLAAGAALALPARSVSAAGANEEVRLGFVSCGGRGSGLMGAFGKIDGVRVAGLCDPDQQRLGGAKAKYPQAKAWTDARDLIDEYSRLAASRSAHLAPSFCGDAIMNGYDCKAALWRVHEEKRESPWVGSTALPTPREPPGHVDTPHPDPQAARPIAWPSPEGECASGGERPSSPMRPVLAM